MFNFFFLFTQRINLIYLFNYNFIFYDFHYDYLIYLNIIFDLKLLCVNYLLALFFIFNHLLVCLSIFTIFHSILTIYY